MKVKYENNDQYADHDLIMATVKAIHVNIQLHGESNILLSIDNIIPDYVFLKIILNLSKNIKKSLTLTRCDNKSCFQTRVYNKCMEKILIRQRGDSDNLVPPPL